MAKFTLDVTPAAIEIGYESDSGYRLGHQYDPANTFLVTKGETTLLSDILSAMISTSTQVDKDNELTSLREEVVSLRAQVNIHGAPGRNPNA